MTTTPSAADRIARLFALDPSLTGASQASSDPAQFEAKVLHSAQQHGIALTSAELQAALAHGVSQAGTGTTALDDKSLAGVAGGFTVISQSFGSPFNVPH